MAGAAAIPGYRPILMQQGAGGFVGQPAQARKGLLLRVISEPQALAHSCEGRFLIRFVDLRCRSAEAQKWRNRYGMLSCQHCISAIVAECRDCGRRCYRGYPWQRPHDQWRPHPLFPLLRPLSQRQLGPQPPSGSLAPWPEVWDSLRPSFDVSAEHSPRQAADQPVVRSSQLLKPASSFAGHRLSCLVP